MSDSGRLIGVEEHFMLPELVSAMQQYLESPAAAGSGWREAGAALEDGARERLGVRSMDLGAGRIAAMDVAGIDLQLLSLSTVANLQMLEPAEATALARVGNDGLAEGVGKHPSRFAGLACLAPQDPGAAAAELERAVGRLGFRGVVINSHARGEYLDAPRFAPIFEAAEALGAPIYLHPALLPAGAVEPYLDYGLMAAMWGYAADAGLHALRIILSGTFDRYPGLQMVLGHLGEHIPFSLPRLDAHHAQTKAKTTPHLERRPSEYFREHFLVSTSGMNHAPASIRFCLEVMGPDRVLFAADYPFEDLSEEVKAFAAVPLTDEERAALAHGNAERVFKL
ncbi:MAG TPA: amidohydrolase family protein [Solirubrobacteraceae bacterium]|nr:amidohydrolase family protein [Solirubrobacteraceae bacterium]